MSTTKTYICKQRRSTMKTIERILATAEQKNIRQADIAKAIGKGTAQITNWKNRNSDPPIELLPKIADLLNVSIEWLITGSETTSNSTSDLPEDEQLLLQHYNQCNQEGKNRIMEHAEFIASKYPQQGKSSEYKIG